MANKRLSIQDIEIMKTMVVKGVAPEDIAKHFNMAISSVHNYKKRFKLQGVKFPDVRGKRPTGSVDIKSEKEMKTVSTTLPTADVTAQSGAMNFVVNGVNVHVSAQAKNVNISRDSIEITF